MQITLVLAGRCLLRCCRTEAIPFPSQRGKLWLQENSLKIEATRREKEVMWELCAHSPQRGRKGVGRTMQQHLPAWAWAWRSKALGRVMGPREDFGRSEAVVQARLRV